jgi:hypothetical protein
MKRIAVLATLVVAVLAIGGSLSAVASAAPPEFSPPFPNPFTSASKATTLETIGKVRVKCTASTDSGMVTGPKTLSVRIDFTSCTTTAVAEVLCQSPNGAPGEIQTELLLGQLGYVTAPPAPVVGLDLSNPTGGPMIVFFCGSLKGEVLGSVIGRVAPLNKVVKPGAHVSVKFTQKAGHQAITMLLGGPLDVPLTRLGGGPLEESGLAFSDALTFAAPITIIA